jgi:hypothetical protein
MDAEKKYSYRLTKSGWFLILFLLFAIMIFVLLFSCKQKDVKVAFDDYQSKWQMISLTSGEVYFGEVFKEDEFYLSLRNIYYLKEKGGLHQSSGVSQKEDFSLIKFGREIHQPFDQMRINRQQVLYIEDLKKESKIIQAIMDYENKDTEIINKIN